MAPDCKGRAELKAYLGSILAPQKLRTLERFPMALDGICANFITQELQTRLCGARLENITQSGKNDLIFHFFTADGSLPLLVSIDPQLAGLYALPEEADPMAPRKKRSKKGQGQDLTPSNFLLFLRKRINAGSVQGVRQVLEDDRVFALDLRARTQIGDEVDLQLIWEIMGKYSNIVLLDDHGIILDSMKRIYSNVNRFREIAPMRPYLAPPQAQGVSYQHFLTETDPWSPLLAQLDPGLSLTKALSRLIRGLSPLLADEIVQRAGLEGKKAWEQLGEAEREDLQKAVRDFCQELAEKAGGSPDEASAGYIFRTEAGGDVVNFAPLLLQQFPHAEKKSSLLAAGGAYWLSKKAAQTFGTAQQRLGQRVKNLRKQNGKRIDMRQRERQDRPKGLQYQRKAELLANNLWAIEDKRAKVAQIQVRDYAAEPVDNEYPVLTLALDPQFHIQGNIEHFFKLSRKIEKRAELAEKDLAYLEAEADFLENVEASLQRARDMADLQAIGEDLDWFDAATSGQHFSFGEEQEALTQEQMDHNLLDRKLDRDTYKNLLSPGKPASKARARQRKKVAAIQKAKQEAKAKKKEEAAAKERASQASQPRRFTSIHGYQIEVGRNNLQNEQLSIRQARPGDWWCHVQKAPGSHVILHLGEDGPASCDFAWEESDLLPDLTQALQLAAWFSGTKNSPGDYVEVDYCPAKNLQKPKGAKPGYVIYHQYRSARIKRLSPEEITPPLA